jgi:hypothetical protein
MSVRPSSARPRLFDDAGKPQCPILERPLRDDACIGPDGVTVSGPVLRTHALLFGEAPATKTPMSLADVRRHYDAERIVARNKNETEDEELDTPEGVSCPFLHTTFERGAVNIDGRAASLHALQHEHARTGISPFTCEPYDTHAYESALLAAAVAIWQGAALDAPRVPEGPCDARVRTAPPPPALPKRMFDAALPYLLPAAGAGLTVEAAHQLLVVGLVAMMNPASDNSTEAVARVLGGVFATSLGICSMAAGADRWRAHPALRNGTRARTAFELAAPAAMLGVLLFAATNGWQRARLDVIGF